MSDLICSVDLGSTSIKAALVSQRGDFEATETAPFPAPLPGGLSYRPEAVLHTALELLRRLTQRVVPGRIQGIALSSQRAGLVPLASDGLAAGPAFSWQDPAGAEEQALLEQRLGPGRFHTLTGLPPSAMWTVCKAMLARRRGLSFTGFCLLHDYILRRLGAPELLSDPSTASSSGLLELATGRWSEEILAAAQLPGLALPRLLPAGSGAGSLDADGAKAAGLPQGIPLYVGGGDQQCAVRGAGAVDPGQVVLCLGTAAVLSCPLSSPRTGDGICTAHVLPQRWVREAIHNAFGGSLQWASRSLGLHDPKELADRALDQLNPPPPVFLPFLAGIGSPDFDNQARGAFLGLSSGHRRSHLAQAVCEGVAFETSRILDHLSGQVQLEGLRTVGGGSQALPVLQLIANTSQHSLLRQDPEASLLGAAMIAWVGVGAWPDLATAASQMSKQRQQRLDPAPPDPLLLQRQAAYLRAIHAVKGWSMEPAP